MDRSLDSIGSCSLDVDADSSDISDTSGSLNFPTPLSVKDITREFTANIRERCTLRSPQLQQTQQPQRTITATAYVNLDPLTGGVHMVLSPPAGDIVDDPQTELHLRQQHHNNSHNSLVQVEAVEKKPSYLNLACCVNGYSNLTTYDSKIRQDINKSREVSPIRPSTSSLQYCKRNNSLAAPVLHPMPLTKQPATAMANKYTAINNEKINNINNNSKNGHQENGDHGYCNGGSPGGKSLGAATSSFIQQRVERLYGPGALAQGFYSPKKHSSLVARQLEQQQQQHLSQQEQLHVSTHSTELSRKFKQLSPSKDYGEFRKKLEDNCTQTATVRLQSELPTHSHNGDVDLPVFRHLSHEFRAQLPTVSPKRNVARISPAPEVLLPPTNGVPVDVVDHEPLRSEEYLGTTKISAPIEPSAAVKPMPEATFIETVPTADVVVKDGNYFLKVLKDEQVRLLALAAVAEKYIDALTNNPDITEDTFGLLRSASGKARLLASQKMKQFEGLCHNNLNRSPEDAFPTTLDDLQGFWDMVYLQVVQVDSIFADIEQLKSNDWHRIVKPTPTSETAPIKSTKNAKTGNLKTKTALAPANSAAAIKREAHRKQLLEMKRQRREALAAAGKNQTACDGVGEDAAADAAAGCGDNVNIGAKNNS